MTDTQNLLGKIAVLRQRLEQAQNPADDAATTAVGLEPTSSSNPVTLLRNKVLRGRNHQDSLDQTFEVAGKSYSLPEEEVQLPKHLCHRSLRLLQQTHDVLSRLKHFADEPLLTEEKQHPAGVFYQDTVLLADVLMRTLQTLPESLSSQMRLCSGIDVLMEEIEQRVGTLARILVRDHAAQRQLAELTQLLHHLHRGQIQDLNPFFSLAEEIIATPGDQPFSFVQEIPPETGHLIAAHSLTVAQVIARVGKLDREWRNRLLQPVVAAMVHDVGMLSLPEDILRTPNALEDSQLELVEKHCRVGAALLAEIQPTQAWLVDCARSHHERMDGTGYPLGLAREGIPAMVRLLAVCDVYAALCSARPHREAQPVNIALVSVLEMAQEGHLDPEYTEVLHQLSPFPAGTAVELSDNSTGVVIATKPGRMRSKTQPIVSLLTDPSGTPLPFPRQIEVGEAAGITIKNCLTGKQRWQRFGSFYPQWA